MKKFSSLNKKFYLISVIFYFLVLEIIWVLIDWRDFKSLQILYDEPIQVKNFIMQMVNHVSLHWQNEFLTLVFKCLSFLVIVVTGDLVITDNKKSSEKLFNTLLPEINF